MGVDAFFLLGPTAVGKTELALELAEQCEAEIVNADAFQLYRGLAILTAQPDAAAQRRVRHHLVGSIEPASAMSAARFAALALQAAEEIRARGKRVIVVGGSGLYVRALSEGLDPLLGANMELRAELSGFSLEELAERLRNGDPQLAARTDLKNRRRVVRAIEISEGALKPVIPSEGKRSRGIPPRYVEGNAAGSLDSIRDDGGLVLVRDREELYRRINERVHEMFRSGVEEEVAALTEIGPTAAQALGLREIQQLLAGEISREQCIAKIQQATRRYAKRQLTWFRHQTTFPQLNLTALSHREAISAITQAFAQG